MHHAGDWTVHIILHALLRCTLLNIHNDIFKLFSAQSVVSSFLEFCNSFD